MFFCKKCGYANNYVKDSIQRKMEGGSTETVTNLFNKFTNGEEIDKVNLVGISGEEILRDDRFDTMNKKDQRKFLSTIKNIDKTFFDEDPEEIETSTIAFHVCRSCNYSEQIKSGTVIYTRKYGFDAGSLEVEDYSHLIHSNILLRSKNYTCRNPKCDTHKNTNLKEAVITRDPTDRVIYVCCACQMSMLG